MTAWIMPGALQRVYAHQGHLEPPTADSRLIWDVYFSAHILPAVALADEMGVFALLEATPLPVKEAATRLNVTDEWAEILLGALASLQFLRLQDVLAGVSG